MALRGNNPFALDHKKARRASSLWRALSNLVFLSLSPFDTLPLPA